MAASTQPNIGDLWFPRRAATVSADHRTKRQAGFDPPNAGAGTSESLSLLLPKGRNSFHPRGVVQRLARASRDVRLLTELNGRLYFSCQEDLAHQLRRADTTTRSGKYE
jgi:hypothetical protein